jgi:SH3-like domain-containing protein
MDIYLTSIKSGERIRIPLLPDRVNVKTGAATISSTIINLGEVKIPRGSNLTGYSWNGTFPGAHLQNAQFVKGWQSPDKLIASMINFMEQGETLRLMITELTVNDDVFIDGFNYEYYGGAGDVSYTLSLTRRRAVTISTVPPQPVTPPPPTGGEPPSDTPKKYGTVKLNNKNSHLNVRKKASTSAAIVGKLKHGATVEIISKTGNWYQIVYAKGTNGKAYVYASYIKVNTTTTSTSGSSASSGSKTSTSTSTAPKAAASTTTAPSTSTTYTVKSGDTLYSIAKAKLGDGSRYTEIYALNKTTIDAKNKGKKCSKYTVYVGTTLRLPTQKASVGGGGGKVVAAAY